MDGVTASQRTEPCRWCRDSQQVTGTEPKKSRVYGPAGEVPQTRWSWANTGRVLKESGSPFTTRRAKNHAAAHG